MEQDNWKTLKNRISSYRSIIPITWLSSKIVGLISIAFSSLLIYMMGYLFLWGYYFGGSGNFSLLSMAINYIPLNRNVAVLIGLFYFLTLIVIGLLLISIFKEGFPMTKLILMVITIVITNVAFILFFYGEISLPLFVKMLKLWILPFFVFIIFAYFLVWLKYPVYSKKFFVYLILFMFNSIIVNEVILSNKLDTYLIPELYVALLYFGLPVLITLKKIKNKFIKVIFKFLLYFTRTVPLFPLLLGLFVKNVIVNGLITILLVSAVVIISENNLHEKTMNLFRKGKENNSKQQYKKDNRQPLFVERPLISIMFIVSTLLIFLVFAPNILIKGGDYFQSIVNNDEYQEISYVWNGRVEMVKGVLVSNKDNTYFISTAEKKLLVVKAQYILIE